MSVVANVAINVDAANAIQQLNRVKAASQDVQGGFNAASSGAKGLGAALTAALGPMLSMAAALAAVQKGLNVAFERGAAEQRLRNLTGSTEEFNAAMALAADSASKFGITQTDASKALADVYGRLKGVGFGLQETGQIYQGFNAIALQSGLAGEEAAGAFFQLSQALGKGKLNGDEFVIVAERMPQLLDAIAQTTGRSRGELTQMAQDGKITSQVLYEALSGAAGASDNLNGKLTAQQQTFNDLRQVTDNLLNTLGQVFAPVVVAGAEGLAKVGQMMVDWYGYLGNVIFPKLQEALQPVITSLKAAFEDINFDAIRVAIQSVLIKGLEIAIGVIGNFSSVLSVVIDGFKALSQNPVFQFIAEQVGRLAGFLGLTNDKVGQFKEEQNKAAAATADTVKNYSSLPPVVDDAKEKAKQLKEEQQKITKAIQESTQAVEASAKITEAVANQRSGLTQAYLQAEQSVNQVLLEQKQTQLENAKTNTDRVRLINEIYQLTVRQAQLEYQATQANIAAEVEKARLAVVSAEQKAKEVESIVHLAAAQGKANDEHYKSLAAIRDAVNLAQIQVGTVAEVATQQERAARAVLEGSLESAKAERSQALTALSTERAAGAAGAFASNMQSAANAAGQAASNLERAAAAQDQGGAYGGAEFGGAFAVSNVALQEQGRAIWDAALERATSGSINPLSIQAILTEAEQQIAQLQAPYFQAQQAKKYQQSIQELEGLGIQPPSATPAYAQSYMASQMSRSAVINPQVNITTGPVTQMDGTNYVTMGDLQQATSTAARQGANLALSQLQSNPSLRRTIGVSR